MLYTVHDNGVSTELSGVEARYAVCVALTNGKLWALAYASHAAGAQILVDALNAQEAHSPPRDGGTVVFPNGESVSAVAGYGGTHDYSAARAENSPPEGTASRDADKPEADDGDTYRIVRFRLFPDKTKIMARAQTGGRLEILTRAQVGAFIADMTNLHSQMVDEPAPDVKPKTEEKPDLIRCEVKGVGSFYYTTTNRAYRGLHGLNRNRELDPLVNVVHQAYFATCHAGDVVLPGDITPVNDVKAIQGADGTPGIPTDRYDRIILCSYTP